MTVERADGADGVLELTLYGRLECPLCDEFKAALAAWSAAHRPVQLEVVDIDGDAALVERYQWRIPVLVAAGRELCAGHFDPARMPAGTP
ncbi:MAG: glutaredoxin family protein [Gammaproteobacteria bacterium]|nr:glutaredoxin family protein [Gammaproteobacteria bacterium]